MQNLNTQFNLIRQSATVAMSDHINALKASGYKIIGLQVGDPDFSTPPAVMDVALKAMQDGLTHYGPSIGTLELRKAVAAKLQRDEGVTYDPGTEILVTHGGIHAYYTAMQSIMNPGDEVLVPDPSWATHSNMVLMLRGKVIRVPAPAENGFIPYFETWERFLTPRTRVIVLNYPSNPTGAYPTREYLQKLQDFAARHDLWIVSDEVYGSLYYEEKPTCAAAFEGAKERTLLVNSLSKSYAMTGWRVGFLAAPARAIENALKAGQNSITCVAPFIQKAAAFALIEPEIQKMTATMRAAYARRRDLVLCISHELESDKVLITPPQGAFYFFLDFRPLKMTSVEICERILDEAGVGLVPGSAFGEQGEGFVRMTIAASDEDVEAGLSQDRRVDGKAVKMKIAFQGEPGAYSEQAVFNYFGQAETQPCESFEAVFDAVVSKSCESALIPIENSLAGSIHQNYDLLLRHSLHIVGEYFLRVQHCLIALPEVKKSDIEKVISHPQALEQCARYLREMGVKVEPVYDTAGSVKMLKESGKHDTAAVASRRAADIYGMQILQEGIEDDPENYTRFLAIQNEAVAPTSEAKTSIVFTLKNQPGALFKALSVFALRDIDLTKIESRPLQGKPWEYLFYIDFVGSTNEPTAQKALDHLEEYAVMLRVLGSYNRFVV